MEDESSFMKLLLMEINSDLGGKKVLAAAFPGDVLYNVCTNSISTWPDGILLSRGFSANTWSSHWGEGGPALYTLHMNELGGRQLQHNLTSK